MHGASWQIRSNTAKSTAMAVGCVLVGALFLWLTRHAQAGDRNTAAAMWLGVLLAAVGVAGLVFSEEVLLTVDESRRMLLLVRHTRFGRRETRLPFAQVEAVNVSRVGSRGDGLPSFWLSIRARDGRRFTTGRWSTDESEMAALADQLASSVGCPSLHGAPLPPTSAAHLGLAALGAVLSYLLWYRVKVGPWCPAMWHGTAPPVIMLVVFAVLLGLLRRWSR